MLNITRITESRARREQREIQQQHLEKAQRRVPPVHYPAAGFTALTSFGFTSDPCAATRAKRIKWPAYAYDLPAGAVFEHDGREYIVLTDSNRYHLNPNTGNRGTATDFFFEDTGFSLGFSDKNVFTGQVTDFSWWINGAPAFNADIGYLDLSRATTIQGMLFSSLAFDADISSWDVSSVVDMSYFLGYAENFNQDLSCWDVGSCLDFSYFALGAGPGATITANNWRIRDGATLDHFFLDSQASAQMRGWSFIAANLDFFMLNYLPSSADGYPDIGDWVFNGDISAVGMFNNSAFNKDISEWRSGQIKNVEAMFYGNAAFNQDLSGWDLSHIDGGYNGNFDYGAISWQANFKPKW